MTQAELADRAGVSRTAVTAIEGERFVPSVATALALADVLGLTVEALFGRGNVPADDETWAWEPADAQARFWRAEVAGRRLRYPAGASPMYTPLPDSGATRTAVSPEETLVIACCDPAAGLLATQFARITGLRLLVLPRSSRQAVEMLRQGLVHAAGLHLATGDDPEQNLRVVQEMLGDGYQLVRIARWQEGIAVAPDAGLRSVRAAKKTKLSWIGREPGSGARQCLDRLLEDRPSPRRIAHNHRGVTEAVRSGWADVGVCVQLASAEAGLGFLPVQEECYDLCIPGEFADDRRFKALLGVLRSATYRRSLAELPGYDVAETGHLVGTT